MWKNETKIAIGCKNHYASVTWTKGLYEKVGRAKCFTRVQSRSRKDGGVPRITHMQLVDVEQG